MAADSPPNFRLRLRRDSNAVIAWFRDMWTRRWFRWLGYLVLAGALFLALIWVVFARDLPSVDQLRNYEPPLPTMVRDGEGKPVHSYARERRVQLEYSEYPQLLVRSISRRRTRHSSAMAASTIRGSSPRSSPI
jgi:penicillin-binding protein 1A